MTDPAISRRHFMALSAGSAVLAAPGARAKRAARSGETFDIVVYGGSSAGVIAAAQARRMGRTAVIVNPYGFLGGMTASGLNSTDADNPAAVSGLTRSFFAEVAKAYARDLPRVHIPTELMRDWQVVPMEPRERWKSFSRVFEPHVAEKAFEELAAAHEVPLLDNEVLDPDDGVRLDRGRIAEIRTLSGRVVAGRMFIDATYEGDLMAAARVPHIVGREGNAAYGETVNGFQMVRNGNVARLSDFGPADQFLADVDPWLVAGDPSSGLLPWISEVALADGLPDHRVQAYNYRVILSDDPENQIPFARPDGYREIDHELMLRNFEAGDHRIPGRFAEIPNRKIDWNTYGAVGTDMAGASFDYPRADQAARKRIDRQHEAYTRGHFWTLAHHPRTPGPIRREMRRWGFARDEFRRNGGFPYMLYVREARRMLSDHVMTEHHCVHREKAPDPVSLATFSMDSHVVQYVVSDRGFVQREGVFNKKVAGPYGISYRSIVPGRGACANLFSPVCLAASHVAYGSIRMEPVFMSLGQVSATAASLAIDRDCSVQDVPYAALAARLRADGVVLEWQG